MPQVGERGKINKLKGNYRVLPDLNHPSVVDALASFITCCILTRQKSHLKI
jgi:hypothetical protein